MSHQRGSWLACRREILLNFRRHPAKTVEERKVLFVRYSLIFIICQRSTILIKRFNTLKLLQKLHMDVKQARVPTANLQNQQQLSRLSSNLRHRGGAQTTVEAAVRGCRRRRTIK